MKPFLKKQLTTLGLLALSIFLFSISFPGLFFKYGISFFSFVALVPMFIVIFRLNYVENAAYGFIFGCCKYLLFNYWLKTFDIAAFAVVPIIFGLYFFMLFPLIKFIYTSFPKHGYIPVSITWLFFEIFRSTNIIGFSYGLLSQSMYRTHLFTGIADIVGSYYLSILIIFPGILAAHYICNKKRASAKQNYLYSLIVYGSIMVFSIIYTQFSKVDYSKSQTLRVSLIQHNINCWLNNNDQTYYQAYSHLEDLSKKAEKNNPDLVIWPETAFTPAIEWHKKYRPKNERARYNLIMKLESFLRTTNALYIIGNNESFNPGRDEHYNTAYLFNKDSIVSKYRKMNLVPFTEEFPYPEKLPWLYDYVNKLGAKQYLRGTEQTLFNINGIDSTILICYEDAFSELPRQSVNNGSSLLINITNDAWTSSSSAALQHLAAATMRTIENRRTLIRAGITGYTAVIDPNGKILDSLELFTRGQLTSDIPIYNEGKTIYTRFGHIIDKVGIYMFIVLFIFAVLKRIILIKKNKNS